MICIAVISGTMGHEENRDQTKWNWAKTEFKERNLEKKNQMSQMLNGVCKYEVSKTSQYLQIRTLLSQLQRI